MVVLLYGKNNFLIFEKKEEIKKSLQRRDPDIEIKSFDFSEDNFSDFLSYLKKQSIFSLKRLIFLDNYNKIFPEKEARKFLELNLEKLVKNKNTQLVFLEREGKNKIISFLLKREVRAYKFEPFSKDNKALFLRYLRKIVNDLGGEITGGALYLLVDFFGYDPWLARGEIEKLLIYSEGKAIDEESVKKNCLPRYASNEIFLLARKILEKDKRGAIFLLEKLLFLGQEPRPIFNSLLSQIRNFLRIKYFPSSQLKFNPFFIQKAKPLVGRFSDEDMLKVYRLLARKDLSVKTTKLTYKEALMDFFRQI